MSAAPLIGIVGGYGAVGQSTIRLLCAWDEAHIRIGGRHPEQAQELNRTALKGAGEVFALDIDDADSLQRFCEGCRVLVNCAGPSYRVLDRVALAAFAAGSHYVDPGGDEPLHARLADCDLKKQGLVAVLTAGMMPGLSGLLPRWLARQGFDQVRQLTAYVGGRGRLTTTSAADYLLNLANSGSDSLAAWRNGAKVARALEPLRDVDLPFFPPGVTAYPFLSPETEQMARQLGIKNVSWYNIFEGGHMLAALGRLQGATVDQEEFPAAVSELSRAADLDLFGKDSYQLFVLRMEGEAGGHPVGRTAVLRATDAHALTGAVNALAISAILRGEIASGLHFASQELDPDKIERLRGTPVITGMQLMETTLPEMEAPPEEGEL